MTRLLERLYNLIALCNHRTYPRHKRTVTGATINLLQHMWATLAKLRVRLGFGVPVFMSYIYICIAIS